MYDIPNLRISQELGVINVGTPTFMRAPGENPGLWALESAMDELAWELNIDPVELRLNPAGVRGVGEIGITGVSAAIANAIYHATGKRIRHLPITPDKIL